MNKNKTIFFHVGLGKTASKYLQYRVFPYFKGVYYIQRTRYRKYPKIIKNTEYPKYFVSNEFDRQLERELDKCKSHFNDAKVIMLIRKHDSWLASQYRRKIKNGSSFMFNEYLDLENDNGFWKISDAYLYPKIEAVLKTFPNSKPLVLLHEDLRKDPLAFIDKIARYMGVEYDKNTINLTPKHTSYSEKQLKFIRKHSKKLFNQKFQYSKKYYVRKLQRIIRLIYRYAVLLVGYMAPKSWIPQGDLIPKEDLAKVAKFYEADWNKCLDYIKNNRPV